MTRPLSVTEFENRMRRDMSWLGINRRSLADIAQDLRRGADHIDQFGWTRFKNFENFHSPTTGPCCAVGSLHSLNMTEGSRICRVADVMWMFSCLYGTDLVHFNDYEAASAQDVTGAMRTVATHIERYLEATDE